MSWPAGTTSLAPLLLTLAKIGKDGQACDPVVMNINLTEELEKLVQQKVETGLFNSASEVVRAALRLMAEHDRLEQIREEEFRKAVAKGLQHLNDGRFTELASDAALSTYMSDVKKRGRELFRKHAPSK